MEKARIAMYDPEVAERAFPNEIILVNGDQLLADVTIQIRNLLIEAWIERQAAKPPLTEEELQRPVEVAILSPLIRVASGPGPITPITTPPLTEHETVAARQMLVKELTGGEEAAIEWFYGPDMAFARALNELCELVSQEPVTAPIIQDERQRTFMEERELMAEEIKRLHRQAYYRSGNRQYKLETLPPLKPASIDYGRLKEVQKRSMARYGRKDEVSTTVPSPSYSVEAPPPPPAGPIGRRARTG
jgi:hypothetical protein